MVINIDLKVTNQGIKTGSPELVRGTKNIYKLNFSFSEEWDEFAKVAVFKILKDSKDKESNYETYSALLEKDSCILPLACMDEKYLQIGVYGESNDQFYPTVWSKYLLIEDGVKEAEEVQDPDPTIYEQILDQFGNKADGIESEGNVVSLLSGNYIIGQTELDFGVTDLDISMDGTILGYTINDGDRENVIDFSEMLESYATKEWTESQGYLTHHQSLAGYETVEGVNAKISASESDIYDYISMLEERVGALEDAVRTLR